MRAKSSLSPERLGDVVVRSEFQSDHPVNLVAAMTGGDDDGNIGVRTYLAEQIETVLLAQSQVEDDEVGLASCKQRGDLVAPRRCDRANIVFFEIIHHQMAHGDVVLDHHADRFPAFGADFTVQGFERVVGGLADFVQTNARRLEAAPGRCICRHPSLRRPGTQYSNPCCTAAHISERRGLRADA
jgi:hypothetical protein